MRGVRNQLPYTVAASCDTGHRNLTNALPFPTISGVLDYNFTHTAYLTHLFTKIPQEARQDDYVLHTDLVVGAG